jgi:hypothetical protein
VSDWQSLTKEQREAVLEHLTNKTILSAANRLAEFVKSGLITEEAAQAILDSYYPAPSDPKRSE